MDKRQGPIQIPPNLTRQVECKSCKSKLFTIVHAIRIYPGGLLSGGRPVTLQENVFVCAGCGEVVDIEPYYQPIEGEKPQIILEK